jgi:FMN reductase
MPTVIALSGSPSERSKTSGVADYVLRRLAARGGEVAHLRLRELPPEALLRGDTGHPVIADAVAALALADGVVIATPTYKAAYSGLLKVFLDLLPQFALAGKVVLPLATGGSLAHVLALDYGLRPVLQSLAPRHVVHSYFLLEGDLALDGDALTVQRDAERVLGTILDDFWQALRRDQTGADSKSSAIYSAGPIL